MIEAAENKIKSINMHPSDGISWFSIYNNVSFFF